MSINYAQCWEDANILRKALAVKAGDRVLSIASGGDNSLALLLDDPQSVTALDYNPEQVCLTALKAAAIRRLEYDDFVRFVGASPGNDRISLYRQVAPYLDSDARLYWDSHRKIIEQGIIHCGKFESYLRLFRKIILPLVHSRQSFTDIMEASSLEEQASLYQRLSQNRWWKRLFSLFFSRPLLGRWGRCHGAFAQVTQTNIADELFARTRHGLTEIPADNNHFLRYILTGNYRLPQSGPDYLLPQHYYHIRERLDRLHLNVAGLEEYLRQNESARFEAFNLSDIFEYLDSRQIENLSQLLGNRATAGARAAFWTMFRSPAIPDKLTEQVASETTRAEILRRKDRGFFYGSFNIWRLGNFAISAASSLANTDREVLP
jgi:S-adenosylmethionine-diacylglycerol 3-amino-3-carboxypropyl transferase